MKNIKSVVAAVLLLLIAVLSVQSAKAVNIIMPTTLVGGSNTVAGVTNASGLALFTGMPGTNCITNVLMGNTTAVFGPGATNSNFTTNGYSGTNAYQPWVVPQISAYNGVVIYNEQVKPGDYGITLAFMGSQAPMSTNEGNEYVTLTFDSTPDMSHWQSNAFSWKVGPLTNNFVFTTNLLPGQASWLALGCYSIANTNAPGVTGSITNPCLKALITK
jgi:hypothetical protein